MEFRCATCVKLDMVLPLDVNEVGEKEKFDLDHCKGSYEEVPTETSDLRTNIRTNVADLGAMQTRSCHICSDQGEVIL
jgi:hypothetical protein